MRVRVTPSAGTQVEAETSAVHVAAARHRGLVMIGEIMGRGARSGNGCLTVMNERKVVSSKDDGTDGRTRDL